MKMVVLVLVLMVVAGVAVAAPTAFHAATGTPHAGGTSRDACWSEPPDLNGLIGSSEQILTFGLESEIANDFVPTDALAHATWSGGYYNNSTPCSSGISTPGFLLRVYEDAGCIPGTALADVSVGPGQFVETSLGCQGGFYPIYQWDADLAVATVAGNLYWYGAVMKDHAFPPQSGRLAAMGIVGCDSVFKSGYFGFPDWTPCLDVFGVAFDASQEFICGVTATQRSSWGQIKGLYH